MNCDCKKRIETEMIGMEWKGCKVIEAELSGYLFKLNENKAKLYSATEVALKVEGRKRPMTISLTHSYCPFCGNKIKEEKPETLTQNQAS